jgi:hypothetical protein
MRLPLFINNRAENIAQLKLQRVVDNSPQVQQTIQHKENGSREIIQLNKPKKGQSRTVEVRKRKNPNCRWRSWCYDGN